MRLRRQHDERDEGLSDPQDRQPPSTLIPMTSGILSPWHLAIFLLVVLLVFGPKRLPEMGRSLGKGIREFKDSLSSVDPAKPNALEAAAPPSEPSAVVQSDAHDGP